MFVVVSSSACFKVFLISNSVWFVTFRIFDASLKFQEGVPDRKMHVVIFAIVEQR